MDVDQFSNDFIEKWSNTHKDQIISLHVSFEWYTLGLILYKGMVWKDDQLRH